MRIRAHVMISGEVQGVFFRQETYRRAKNLSVKGWVKNLFDGGVEAVFEGEEEDVGAMIDFCKKGPPGANVKDVEVKDERYRGEYEGFAIRY